MARKKERSKQMIIILAILLLTFAVVFSIYNNKPVRTSPEEVPNQLSDESATDDTTLVVEEPEPNYECSGGTTPACCVCNTQIGSGDNLAMNEYCDLDQAKANCDAYCNSHGGTKGIWPQACFSPTDPTPTDYCCRVTGQQPTTKRGAFGLSPTGLIALCGGTGAHSEGTC